MSNIKLKGTDMEVDSTFIMRSIKNLINANGNDIAKIKNPTEEIQEIAVRSTNGSAIKYIENPTISIQRLAIRYNGSNLRFIKNKTVDIINEALASNGASIEHVENPSLDQMLLAVKNSYIALGKIKNPPHEVIIAAVTAQARSIQFVNSPCPEAEAIAYGRSRSNIAYIKYPTRAIQEEFVNYLLNNPFATLDSGYSYKYPISDVGRYCPNLDIDLAKKIFAVHRTSFDSNLSNCTEEIQIMRLEKSPSSIRLITNPSLRVQKKAIEKSAIAFHYINSPHSDIISENIDKIKTRQHAVKCYHLSKDDTTKVFLKIKFGLDKLRKRKNQR